VVIVDVGTHLDLFDVLRLLRLARLVGLLLRLVAVLADIEELAHGRIGSGRDLDQVQADLFGLFDSFAGVHDAEVFAVLINDANLVGLDQIVEFGSGLDRGREHAPGWTGYGQSPFLPNWRALLSG